jgi:5-formyltetrahydrofolate cyclo-ligase
MTEATLVEAARALDAAKRALRADISRALPASGSAEHAAASAKAQDRLAASRQAALASCIALYRATPSECATAALVDRFLAQGKDVCFPAVSPGEQVLRFLRPHGPTRAGHLGIEEHEDAEHARVPLASIDLFVVPARAVDPTGHRLGRGRGYYDATLAAAGARAVRICLVFDQQVVPVVPAAAHDAQVDAVCTDARWLDCQRSAP